MRSINKVIVSGRVSEKPELNPRSQFAVTNVKINVVETKKDQKTNQLVNETVVMEVAFFGEQAHEVVRTLQPNDFIVIEGKVRVSERMSQTGGTFLTTSIQAFAYDVVSAGDQSAAPAQPRATKPASGGNVYQNDYQQAQAGEDDIPF